MGREFCDTDENQPQHNYSLNQRHKFQICFLRVAAIAAAVIAENSAVADHQGASMSALLHQHVKRFSGLYTGPYFDTSIATNITAQLGTHAFLPCKVKQLGNKSVSTVANTFLFCSMRCCRAQTGADCDERIMSFCFINNRSKGINNVLREKYWDIINFAKISGDEFSSDLWVWSWKIGKTPRDDIISLKI